MPDGSVPLLIVLILLLILSAFFSSIETAYSCASRIKLRSLANCGNNKAKKTLDLAENKFDKLITTILVGNNIVNLTSATISTIFFAKIITDSEVSASLISTIVITLAVLIFGEITPKFIAKTYPEKFSITFYPIIILFFYLLYPFNFIFSGWKWLIAKIFRLKNNDVITEEEIMTIVEEAEEDGTIKKEETNLIRSVIEFDDLEVGDILVPRVNVVAIDIDTPLNEILNIFRNEGYSRLPVYKENIDQIVGIIHSKDFFNTYLNNGTNINDILQDVYYTTEHVKISNLLKQLQKKSTHLAVVLDEYGGTLGIVTLEDILEELVGEIYDEFDEVINYIKQISDNTYLIDCNAPLSELFEQFNLSTDIEKFDATTVSGFIIEYLGEIPKTQRKFTYKNLEFEVLKATVKKVHQVKLTILKTEEK